jgi:hypothetical protein
MRDGHSLDLAAGPPDCGAGSTDGDVAADVLASLLLQPPSPAPGEVPRLQLTGAHITGRLSLPHAKIEVPISLINCCFDERIELDNAALRAADFTGCHLPAFQADGLRVDSDLTLVRLITSRVSLFRVDIGGNLWLNAADVSGAGPGFAVHAAQLRVGGGLYAESIRVTGGLNLWGAQAFTIELTNARLACDAGPALRGDGLAVGHDLHCSSLMISNGGVTLFGATIGGQFWLNNADVRNTTGWAMTAPTITVGGGMYARGLAAHGGVNLFGIVVGESVELPASTLSTPRGLSLRAPGARVGASIILDESASMTGDVDLSRAEIKGTLTFSSAAFAEGTAVDLQRAAIGTLDLTRLNARPAALDLRGARIATIDDDVDSWPERIAFDMLTYQALNPALPASRRLAWLRRGNDSQHPQPYEQLATHYRQLGQDDDARAVLLARHRIRRRNLKPLARLWGYLEDVTVGYGYRPARALGWLLALTAVVAIMFSAAPPRPVQASHPRFQPVAYALDLILPILDLGQEKAFVPIGATQWIAWTSALTGWLLATAVIAGITRRLVRS